MRHALITRITKHLKHCQLHSLVVIDEVQKIAPGVLDVLMPAFGDRGSLTTATGNNILLLSIVQYDICNVYIYITCVL